LVWLLSALGADRYQRTTKAAIDVLLQYFACILGNSVVEFDTSSLARSERLKLKIRWYKDR